MNQNVKGPLKKKDMICGHFRVFLFPPVTDGVSVIHSMSGAESYRWALDTI